MLIPTPEICILNSTTARLGAIPAASFPDVPSLELQYSSDAGENWLSAQTGIVADTIYDIALASGVLVRLHAAVASESESTSESASESASPSISESASPSTPPSTPPSPSASQSASPSASESESASASPSTEDPPCPPGWAWDPVKGGCVGSCPEDYCWDEQTQSCILCGGESNPPGPNSNSNGSWPDGDGYTGDANTYDDDFDSTGTSGDPPEENDNACSIVLTAAPNTGYNPGSGYHLAYRFTGASGEGVSNGAESGTGATFTPAGYQLSSTITLNVGCGMISAFYCQVVLVDEEDDTYQSCLGSMTVFPYYYKCVCPDTEEG